MAPAASAPPARRSGPAPEVELVLGRETEQAVIGAALQAARVGMSGVVVVRGAPGMGKSALLRFAQTEQRDLQRLAVTGVEAESGFPYAGVHRLLIPVLDRTEELPPHHRDALAVAFGQAPGGAGGCFLVAQAVLTLLAEVADERPLVCIVDDVHWLDSESVEVLTLVARRLHADGVAMILATRSGVDLGAHLDDLPVLDLDALSTEHSVMLLLESAPSAVDPLVADQLAGACAGCPLALIEAGRSLSSDQLNGGSWLPATVPMAPGLEAHFRRQISALPDVTQALLLLVAAEPSHDGDSVRRAAAVLGLPLDALDAAVDAGLVDRSAPWQIRHPLIRSAAYSAAPNADRRRTHRALASVIDRDASLDRHALHRAAASPGPDEDVALLLEEAAVAAADRGGYAAQATLRTRAAELTPDPVDRARRLLDAAEAALIAGLKPRAAALVRRVDVAAVPPILQARAHRLRGALDAFTVPGEVAAVHLASARVLEELDLRLARDTYAEALQAALISGQFTRGTTVAEVALAVRRAPRPTVAETTVVDQLLDGLAARLTVGFPEAGPLLQAGVDAVGSGDLTSSGRTLWSLLGQAAVIEIWDVGRYRDILERLEQTQRARGELDSLRVTLLGLCRLEVWAGRFPAADAYRMEATALSRVIDGPGASADLWDSLGAELLAWQDRTTDVRRAIRLLTGDFPEAIGAGAAANIGWLSLTILELSHGHYREARDAALVLFADDVPPDATLVLPDLVEAAVRTGDLESAHAAAARLSLRATAGATDWGLGLVARCQALLADPDDAEPLYLEAIERLGRSAVRTEAARSHLLYGEWLRREKRKSEARAQLRVAHDLFVEMDAPAFAERARVELAATGERARKRSAEHAQDLTPQEHHIARLAAGGDTNAEIAERLYISARTVDYHLRKVYRKLGIESRRDLRGAFE